MPKRRRLAVGIYEDAHGISVIYSSHGKPIETRFDPGTPLERLKRWRATQVGQAAALAPRDPRGSLARDVVRYLKRLKGTPGYKAARAHLRAWVQRFPGVRRWQLTSDDIATALAEWRAAGYSTQTIRHRYRYLRALFAQLDGAKAPSPFDDVRMPAKPRGRAVSVDDTVIAAVARSLRLHEMPGVRRLHDAKTRARFLVLATTGRRPIEVKRAQRADVDLHRRLWFTRTAKGGVHTVIILNDEMLAAWQLFIAAGAWGTYDDRSFSKTLRRHGWPAGIRPYNLRHTTALAIRARGGDLQDVQDQLGHTSIATAREFYLQADPTRQAAISRVLEGRFAPAAFATVPRATPTTARRQDAKGQENTRISAGQDRAQHSARRPKK